MTEPLELTLEGAHGDELHVRFHLAGAPISDDRVGDREQFAGRLLNAFAVGRVELRDGAVADLWVADYHLIRDLAERFGVVAPDPDPELVCRNCQAAVDVDPLGRDPESLLEGSASGEPPPATWAREVDGVRGVEIVPVRVREARPYWRALMQPPAAIAPDVVQALGIRAMDTRGGRLSSPAQMARRFDRGSELLLDVVTALYLLANYPPRLRFPQMCAECGTVHDVATPSLREGDEMPAALDAIFGAEVDAAWRLPTFDEFASHADRLRSEVFRERAVAGLVLEVEDGVPPVDDSGEPLMGSYQPTHDPISGEPRFVISLYYRTFVSMFAEAPYDVEAEISETLDHEVEHHLHHLEGYDPLDAEERAEARRDLERTFGSRAVARAERGAVFGELGRIARFFFVPLLLLGLALAALVAAGVIE